MSLSQGDLENIWQNTTPDIGLDFHGRPRDNLIIDSQVVTHELFTANDILSEVSQIDSSVTYGVSETTVNNTISQFRDGISGDLQWMVFKVKQKGESSYFRKKELDRLPDGHPDKQRSVEDDIYRYGFNWPYDYFSIVELVNIKATTQFKATTPLRNLSQENANMLNFRKDNS